MANIDIGDIVHISDVSLPEGARPSITDRDFVIANISAPSSLKSEEEEEEEAAAAEAEAEEEEAEEEEAEE